MNFVAANKRAIYNFTDFRSRASRSEYWLAFLGYVIVYIIANMVDYVFPFPVFSFAVMIALLVPMLAVGVRRLHDTDRSGWWMLLAFIPIIGGIAVLVLLCLSGTEGPNRFGPKPLSRS